MTEQVLRRFSLAKGLSSVSLSAMPFTRMLTPSRQTSSSQNRTSYARRPHGLRHRDPVDFPQAEYMSRRQSRIHSRRNDDEN